MKTYIWLFTLIILLLGGCSKESTNPIVNDDGTLNSNIQTIDNVNAANGDVSTAIDGNNKLHVAYFSFNLGLKYATNKTGSWVSTMIHPEDTSTTMSVYNDIAVDSSGFAHIVYTISGLRVTDESAVYYATNKTGIWVKTKIAFATGSDFSGAGLAVTSTGNVHIVYGDHTMSLMYKHNLSGSWTSAGNLGSYWTSVRPRLALDASNNVYVAYEHGGEGTLHLQVINSAGSLVSNSILDGVSGSGVSVGWSPDIAINKTNGFVLTPYWNYDSKLLKIYNGGTITTLDTLNNWTDPAIVTDISGKAHICYTDLTTYELYYVSNKTGPWVKEIITASVTARGSALVVEPTGKLHFIYCVKGVNSLRVITK